MGETQSKLYHQLATQEKGRRRGLNTKYTFPYLLNCSSWEFLAQSRAIQRESTAKGERARKKRTSEQISRQIPGTLRSSNSIHGSLVQSPEASEDQFAPQNKNVHKDGLAEWSRGKQGGKILAEECHPGSCDSSCTPSAKLQGKCTCLCTKTCITDHRPQAHGTFQWIAE